MRKEELRGFLLQAGAVAVGFARAERVGEEDLDIFNRWIASGKNAGMEYMHNYPDLRFDPRRLHEGCKTVISVAFPYRQPVLRDKALPVISQYAYGKDYHKEIRWRLKPIVRQLDSENDGKSRVCVDSAPVRERYWARKSGIGFTAVNGQLYVDNAGSYVFLAEIITTIEFEPDEPSSMKCLECGACVRACPGKAIAANGSVDARRCLSYLSIEHKGEWKHPDPDSSVITLFGCDVCQTVCPMNRIANPAYALPEFLPSDFMLTLSEGVIKTMTDADFLARFENSPLRRAGLSKLHSNMKTQNTTLCNCNNNKNVPNK